MSDFQNFVNKELPKRVATNADPTSVPQGKVFVTTGEGLLTELASPSDGTGQVVEREEFELTDTDISNMYVPISYEPISGSTITMDIKNAPAQYQGDDFDQDDSFAKRITWEGYNLQDVLQAGDKIIISYFREA